MDTAEFYDEFVDYQVRVGITDRHRGIMRALVRHGLRPHHQVLEVGCGIGALTGLLAKELRAGGSVTGVDLSPKSIEVARDRLVGRPNVRLVTGDVLEETLDTRFDVVVLADVIEHIPLERHGALFDRIGSWLAPEGFVLLNYPNPHYLEWCREHRPDDLQVVDEPVHADVLLAHARPHGFYLDFLETYSVWVREGDYVLAILRPRAGVGTFTVIPDRPSLLAHARDWIRLRVRRARRPDAADDLRGRD
jgi:trans-aconitate 2-methyltransferase